MVPKAGFEESVLPHMKAAFNLAYWIVRNREEAEDVVQDAYLRAFRGFSKFDGSAPKPWLLTIVRNVAYRSLQNRSRDSKVIVLSEDANFDVLEASSAEHSAEVQLVAESDRQQLLAALAAMPVNYREVIVLRELEGLSYEEIASTIHAPVGTVMSRLSRARAGLREALIRKADKKESDAV